jgi:hypothetical protein
LALLEVATLSVPGTSDPIGWCTLFFPPTVLPENAGLFCGGFDAPTVLLEDVG